MQLDLDTASFKRLTELGKQFPRAGRSALNKLAASTRTFVSSEIRGTYNIKKSDLDPNISVFKATGNSLEARLRAGGKALKLLYFGARQTKTGVVAKVKKGGSFRIGRGFIATMRSGHENVFMRTGKTRLPIKGLYGPRIAALFGSSYMKNAVQNFVSVRFPEILKQELKYFFSKTSA